MGQCANDVFLADQVFEPAGSPFSCKRLITHAVIALYGDRSGAGDKQADNSTSPRPLSRHMRWLSSIGCDIREPITACEWWRPAPATPRRPSPPLPLLPSGPGGVCGISSRGHRRGSPLMAEREGFEPSVRGYRTHAFQACSFDRSDTSPDVTSKCICAANQQQFIRL